MDVVEPKEETIINSQCKCNKCSMSHPQNQNNFCDDCGTKKPPQPSLLLLSHVSNKHIDISINIYIYIQYLKTFANI